MRISGQFFPNYMDQLLEGGWLPVIFLCSDCRYKSDCCKCCFRGAKANTKLFARYVTLILLLLIISLQTLSWSGQAAVPGGNHCLIHFYSSGEGQLCQEGYILSRLNQFALTAVNFWVICSGTTVCHLDYFPSYTGQSQRSLGVWVSVSSLS